MREGPLSMDDELQETLNKYSLMVYRLAYAQVRNKYDADDIYQEVFLRLVKANPAFESEEHRKAWLIRVTVNCCKSFWHSAWRRFTVPFQEQADSAAPTWTEDEFIGIEDALRTLSQKSRTIIQLFYYERMPVEQISHALKIPASTVRTQLSRARKKLKISFMYKEEQANV